MEMSYIELLKLAVYIEQQGYNFYQSLLTKTNNLKTIELLNFLADQEKEHKENFIKILETHSNIAQEKQLFFTDDDTVKYLSSFTDEKIFSNLLDLQKTKKDSLSFNECITIAKTAEKSSYDFYKKLEDSFYDTETKQTIAQMAEEEEKHFILLENLN